MAKELNVPEVAKLPDLTVAYIADVGVLPDFQGQGIGGRALNASLYGKARFTPTAVARTKAEPPTNLLPWFLAKGQEVIAKYDDGSGRVILSGPVKSLELPTLELGL